MVRSNREFLIKELIMITKFKYSVKRIVDLDNEKAFQELILFFYNGSMFC